MQLQFLVPWCLGALVPWCLGVLVVILFLLSAGSIGTGLDGLIGASAFKPNSVQFVCLLNPSMVSPTSLYLRLRGTP
jgi:hypothetical protein